MMGVVIAALTPPSRLTMIPVYMNNVSQRNTPNISPGKLLAGMLEAEVVQFAV